MTQPRQRLDAALVARGIAPTRSRARDAIRRGHVTVDGTAETRASRMVGPNATLDSADPAAGYVSRGALKLIAALDAFDFDPAGRVCADLGASTGGFTQVLLERGAAHVHAVDVGHGQLAEEIAGDARVTSREGLNARELTADHLSPPPSALTADLSFISLRTALPAPLACLERPAWLALLVKPQFEVGRAHVGKGGLVRDETAARASVQSVADWLTAESWTVLPPIPSPLRGGDGNTEYLLGATAS